MQRSWSSNVGRVEDWAPKQLGRPFDPVRTRILPWERPNPPVRGNPAAEPRAPAVRGTTKDHGTGRSGSVPRVKMARSQSKPTHKSFARNFWWSPRFRTWRVIPGAFWLGKGSQYSSCGCVGLDVNLSLGACLETLFEAWFDVHPILPQTQVSISVRDFGQKHTSRLVCTLIVHGFSSTSPCTMTVFSVCIT